MSKFIAAKMYQSTGILAVLLGGVLSAFTAKQPTTFAMWASAYLVLVMGAAQVLFGSAMVDVRHSARRLYAAWGLFNIGNILVIVSTGMKYAGIEGNIAVTAAGSVLIGVGLLLYGWCIRAQRSSRLKWYAYGVAALLIVSLPIGMILAHK